MKIAIDGPAGAGKSTVARALARRLGFSYLDSGALYRALAWAALSQGADLDGEEGLARLLDSLQLRPDSAGVWVKGTLVTSELRRPDVDEAASRVARHPAVRAAMVRLQRQLGEGVDMIADGRDIGSVVWPDAEVKIFLTASLATRAARRALEQPEADRGQIAQAIAERDAHDAGRPVGALLIAPGAIVVDTSDLSVEETVARLAEIVEAVP